CLIGDRKRPKAQLLGMRGAPGNTINHATSYWVPTHDRRVFVERVDVVSGVGHDRARALGSAARFHGLRRVVSNPGVSIEHVREQTGFALVVPGDVIETRAPTPDELTLIRERIDPDNRGARE